MCAKMRMGGDKYIVYAGLSHCSVLTYYAEYNVSISHFISFYRERLSDSAVLIASGICVSRNMFSGGGALAPSPNFCNKNMIFCTNSDKKGSAQ